MKYYHDIKEHFYNSSFGNTTGQIVASIFKKADNLIEEQGLEAYYLKNLFLEDKPFELFLFCSNNCIINLGIENNSFITIKYISMDSVYSIAMKENTKDTKEKTLSICFKNGEHIEFSSKNDTNEYHRSKFSDLIDQICKIAIMKLNDLKNK
jgi:hypothetical protein